MHYFGGVCWNKPTAGWYTWNMKTFVKRSRQIWAQLNRVSKHDMRQFVAYFVAGSSYFWSGYITFAICYGALHWRWWPAKMLADAVGWTLNYILQRYWAFASNKLRNDEAHTVEKYALLTAVNFGIDYAIVGSLKALGVSPYLGLFISAGFFTVWNYLWYRFWVFLGANKTEKSGKQGDEK